MGFKKRNRKSSAKGGFELGTIMSETQYRESHSVKHRIRLLSYRSRGTLMSYTDHSVQRRLKSNAPNDMSFTIYTGWSIIVFSSVD